MKVIIRAALVGLAMLSVGIARGEELEFPRIIKTRYEAIDQKLGGQFLLWSERERIQYGLDPKLYPGALSVQITQVTPGNGATVLTFVEIKTTQNSVPDNLYFTGATRFRVSGMVLRSSNFPAGSMTPIP